LYSSIASTKIVPAILKELIVTSKNYAGAVYKKIGKFQEMLVVLQKFYK
jgi:hypothetical protein